MNYFIAALLYTGYISVSVALISLYELLPLLCYMGFWSLASTPYLTHYASSRTQKDGYKNNI